MVGLTGLHGKLCLLCIRLPLTAALARQHVSALFSCATGHVCAACVWFRCAVAFPVHVGFGDIYLRNIRVLSAVEIFKMVGNRTDPH